MSLKSIRPIPRALPFDRNLYLLFVRFSSSFIQFIHSRKEIPSLDHLPSSVLFVEKMFESIRRFFRFVHWLYLQYLLNTALYMLEPWERLLFSALLFVIISTAIYSALVFLPHHVRSMAHLYS